MTKQVKQKVHDEKIIPKALFDRALGAIQLDKHIKDKQALLEKDKEYLRSVAEGETIPIPGHGSVQVKNAPAAKEGGEEVTIYTFSAEEFLKLPKDLQNRLQAAGVIKITKTKTPATPKGVASVCFVHNK